MGAIWFKRAELVGASSDTVGYKAGVALSREELAEHTQGMGIDDWWVGDDAQAICVRSEEFAEAIEQLLYAVGNAPTPRILRPEIELFHRYKGRPAQLDLLRKVLDLLKNLPREGDGPVDLTPLLEQSKQRLGLDGVRIALNTLTGSSCISMPILGRR